MVEWKLITVSQSLTKKMALALCITLTDTGQRDIWSFIFFETLEHKKILPGSDSTHKHKKIIYSNNIFTLTFLMYVEEF